ncbi:F-box/kelch-repeat protein At1g15670-like [Curcuma longa]|uniref:F-box/kelch-repeat protein At1g15670-like n=1 Tax=Curcuma longa TaxID=136217 RepID=UPI003D9DCC0D
MEAAELIPGLPDCLALECLLRLPFHAILNARTVCKRWKHELDSPSFYRIRKAAGLAPRVVSLILRGKLPHTMGMFHLLLYEPDTDVCTVRRLAPHLPLMRPLRLRMAFSYAAIVGRELLVIENRRTGDGEVHFYDLLSGVWRPGAPNPVPERFHFKTSVLNGEKKVLVIGGHDGKGNKLPLALVYDLSIKTWFEIPDLGQGRSIDGGGNFCDKFWQISKEEEYNSVIRRCREELLVDDDDDLRFYRTEGGKEIIMYVPKEKKKSEEMAMMKFILNEKVLTKLRQRLGIFPNEIGRYIESFYNGLL